MSQSADKPDLIHENPKRYSRYYTYIEPIVTDPVIRGYFGLIASIFLVAFFIIFALSPTFTTILGLIRKIDDQKKTITAMDNKINNLILAQENYSQVEPSLPLLSSALPEKPAPETVLDDIVKTASTSAVSINTLQFNLINYSGKSASSATPMSKLGLQTVEFTLQLAGSENQVHSFLNRLEHLPRLISISAISLQTQDKTAALAADVPGMGYYVLSKTHAQ